MAFENSSKRYPCGDCLHNFTYYQLIENKRAEKHSRSPALTDSTGAGSPGQLLSASDSQDRQLRGTNCRVCASCELNMRLKEWDQLSAEYKEANPEYDTAQGVKRDIKKDIETAKKK